MSIEPEESDIVTNVGLTVENLIQEKKINICPKIWNVSRSIIMFNRVPKTGSSTLTGMFRKFKPPWPFRHKMCMELHGQNADTKIDWRRHVGRCVKDHNREHIVYNNHLR